MLYMDKPKVLASLKKIKRILAIFLQRWGILIIGSILLTWYLQYRISKNDADATWQSMDEKPMIFWYSALIIFTLMVIIYGIFRRPFRKESATRIRLPRQSDHGRSEPCLGSPGSYFGEPPGNIAPGRSHSEEWRLFRRRQQKKIPLPPASPRPPWRREEFPSKSAPARSR